MTSESILLLGCGPMAIAYAQVLKAMQIPVIAVGRGQERAAQFTSETGIQAHHGGVESWLATQPALPKRAIVAVGEKWIGHTARLLMDAGMKTLLVEKPGGHDAEDIRAVATAARKHKATVSVGYNRRFYASTLEAQKRIAEDGGATSFRFEFTEWGHVIAGLEKEEGVKEEWFLSNTTHVIDLAFHLGGAPADMRCFTEGSLAWHPRAARYSGAGVTQQKALFSYHANWESPGRFSLEILTPKRRLIFQPLESLQQQLPGSVAVAPVEIDDALDKQFKPGLYRQVEAFLNQDPALLDIHAQVEKLALYQRMRGDNA